MEVWFIDCSHNYIAQARDMAKYHPCLAVVFLKRLQWLAHTDFTLLLSVTVHCRNQRLFRRIFRLYHHI